MGLPPENLIDIGASLRQATNDGPIWSVNSEQLNVNLLCLPSGDGVAPHVNSEVDVVLVIFEGRDAAGKGGTIKRFTEHLNPQSIPWFFRCALASPSLYRAA